MNRVVSIVLACTCLGAPTAAAQSSTDSAAMGDMGDTHAMTAVHEAMDHSDVTSSHMRLTTARTATPADSARARALVAQMRSALARYTDVHAAVADGYRRFLPGVKQPVYHYTNWLHGLAAAFDFDPAKPTSLLYKEGPDGRLQLVGAMYTAPARSSEADLDARVPLGVTHWHQHINWCLPPRGAEQRWRETRDGQPVFGPKSPIATAAACDAVGGRFIPRIFGWMVHINAFAGDDPAMIWGGAEGDHHHDH